MGPVPCASLVLSLVVTILFGTPAAAQDAAPGATPVAAPAAIPVAAAAASPAAGAAEILFVQSFTTGRLEPGTEAGAAILTLQGFVGETIYFSDRPERTAGTIALTQFLEIMAQ